MYRNSVGFKYLLRTASVDINYFICDFLEKAN